MIHFQPFEDRVRQIRSIINALTYFALNYHFFLFTKYTDSSKYPMVANSVIGIIFLTIVANLIITLSVLITPFIRKLQLLYVKIASRRRRSRKSAFKRRKTKGERKTVSFSIDVEPVKPNQPIEVSQS